MPLPFLVPLAISGISALGGLLANRKSKQEQESKSTSVDNIDQYTRPEYDPKSLIMRDLLMHQFLGRTEDDNDYWGGYAREGLNDINRGSDLNRQAIDNLLAARGLGRTTAGANSYISNEMNRLNQGNSLMNQIPLLADQRRRQNLLDASQFFNQLPVGQHVTGTTTRNTTSSGTVTNPGNMLGGMFGNLAGTLAGLYGQGAFGGKGGKINV